MGPKTKKDFQSDGTTKASFVMRSGPIFPLVLPLSRKDFAVISIVNFG